MPGRPAAAVPGSGGPQRLLKGALGLTVIALLAPAGCSGGPAEVGDFEDLSITAEPAQGWAPLSVEFSAEFAPENGDVVAPEGTTYQWDFGDEAQSSEPTPTHEYQRPGDYPVRLEVSGGSDLSGSAETAITVTAWEPDAWTAEANAICTETQRLASEGSSGTEAPNVPDLDSGATLAAEEVEKLQALGLPGEGSDEVEAWLDDLSAAAESFRVFANTFAADSSDPALVEQNAGLDAAYASVAEQAIQLGLDSCAGGSGA